MPDEINAEHGPTREEQELELTGIFRADWRFGARNRQSKIGPQVMHSPFTGHGSKV